MAVAPSVGIIRPLWPLDGHSMGGGTRGPQHWGLGLALGAKPGSSCWSSLSSSNTSLLWGRRQQELLVTALVWILEGQMGQDPVAGTASSQRTPKGPGPLTR